jgi:hypothetical protein
MGVLDAVEVLVRFYTLVIFPRMLGFRQTRLFSKGMGVDVLVVVVMVVMMMAVMVMVVIVMAVVLVVMVVMVVAVVMRVMAAIMVMRVVMAVLRVIIGFVDVARLPGTDIERNGPDDDQDRQGDAGPQQEGIELVRQHQIEDVILSIPGLQAHVQHDADPGVKPDHEDREDLIEIIAFAVFFVMMMSH